jgi:hypothetical protein
MAQPAKGTIRKQVQLPLSVAFRISLLNIRVRFLRSLITAAGVMLGIALFTAVRTANLYAPPLDPNDPVALETAHAPDMAGGDEPSLVRRGHCELHADGGGGTVP